MPTQPAARPECPPDRYCVLALGGRDAAAFLQGQLTQDVLSLAPGELRLAALLTPAGRVVAVPWLLARDAGFALVLPAALAEPVRERLARFVLRARVTLALEAVGAELGARLAATLRATGEPWPAGLDAAGRWTLALIRAGHPEIGAEASEEWIPQMLNLDLIAAISFHKGCYTGQEIVARTQHLGRIKRRMFRLAAPAAAPPAPKAALLAGGRKVGEVVLAAAAGTGVELLAVVGLDARDALLSLDNGVACARLPLPYAVS